jgi:HEAT repeat protein
LSLDAVAGLLERNDITALGAAKEALSKPASELSARLLHNLSYSISEGVTDPDAIPVLNQLSGSSHTEVRRAVASALMHIKSSTSKDVQIRLLSDADFETRYYAAAGLAESTGQKEWHPSMEQFRAEEWRYVNHWRETPQ